LDLRQLTHKIELQFPQLEGRLLTAVQQTPSGDTELNYLQQRVVEEALACGTQNHWEELVPRSRIALAQTGHWLALGALAVSLFYLPRTENHQLIARLTDFSLSVSPGDTSVERGNSVVIFARFGKLLPPGVDLIIGQT